MAPQPDPVGQAARLSETAIAFACAGRAVTETAVAFAGENWAFLERFSVALVLLVSTVAIQGRAVVMGVSCWPASVVAEVSLVASSPRHSCLCAKKFGLLGLMVGVSAKKFAQRTKNGENPWFVACWAKFFAEMPVEGRCWASFFADWQSWDPTGRVVLRRGPGSLPRPPPIGLT